MGLGLSLRGDGASVEADQLRTTALLVCPVLFSTLGETIQQKSLFFCCRVTGMPKEKYDPPDPRRCYTIMSAEEAASGKKSYWAELEISGESDLSQWREETKGSELKADLNFCQNCTHKLLCRGRLCLCLMSVSFCNSTPNH